MGAAPAVTRTEQARLTRALIMTTAERLFAERGYDATSLQAIADEIGLTKAAVYYYFKTKADLLHSGAQDNYTRLSALLEAGAALRNRRERIDFVVDGFIELMMAKRQIINIVSHDPAMRREKKFTEQSTAMVTRGLQVLFGDSPSLGEQAAYHLLVGVPDVIAAMPGLTDVELRGVLPALCRRVLDVRD